MAESTTYFVLSKQATAIASQMQDSGIFPDAMSAAKFGMAYAIKYYWDEVGSIEVVQRLIQTYDSSGNSYGIATVDSDKFIEQLMDALYPDSGMPYKCAKVLMCYGLNKLSDLLEDGKLFPINRNM